MLCDRSILRAEKSLFRLSDVMGCSLHGDGKLSSSPSV